jgi:integrase
VRSDYICANDIEKLLKLLQPANRLVCKLALNTGLRIDDCLSIEKSQLRERYTAIEKKTGLHRRVWIGKKLLYELKRFCAGNGSRFVFPHRFDNNRHRTRQAVFKDIKAQCEKLGIKSNISPHSFRKAYAVKYFKKAGSLEAVQKRLGHKKLETTILYALADKINGSVQ